MTFYDVFLIFILLYLLFNIRENNVRIRKLQRDVRQLKAFH